MLALLCIKTQTGFNFSISKDNLVYPNASSIQYIKANLISYISSTGHSKQHTNLNCEMYLTTSANARYSSMWHRFPRLMDIHQRMQKIFDTLCCDVQIAVTSTDLMRKIRESSYQSMGGNQLDRAQELRI